MKILFSLILSLCLPINSFAQENHENYKEESDLKSNYSSEYRNKLDKERTSKETIPDAYYDNFDLLKRTETNSESTNTSVTESDSLALVALYNSTNGDNWFDNSNWLTGAVNTWFGITVSGEYVTKISLIRNNLQGPLPQELGNLSNLKQLHLDDNQLSGPLPFELGSLSNLRELWLQSNHLSGNIPPEIGNLTDLYFFDLARNQLTGEIPPEIGFLKNLNYLLLSANQLTGNIPTELGNLSNLGYLDLSYNQLSGLIPSELRNMLLLEVLFLSSNQLSGSIPTDLGNLSHLVNLNLRSNQLSETIPSEIGDLIQLKSLDLSSNQFSGSVPTEFGNLSNLTSLYLFSNNLTQLPDLSGLVNLRSFHIYNNYFTFDDLQNTGLNFFNIIYLGYSPQFDLSEPLQTISGDNIILSFTTEGIDDTYQWFKNGKAIEGEISNELSILDSGEGVYCCEVHNSGYPGLILTTSVIFHNVSNTQGVVSEDYNSLIALYNSTMGDDWDENQNWLSANNVSEWFGITVSKGAVSEIQLGYNNLSGSIPTEIGDLSNLLYLSLGNNNLSGSIPIEIGNLSNLINLHLEENNLSGTIPNEIYNLSRLKELWLRVNNLEGNISPNVQNLSNLETLQLRTNPLTGTIPSEIGNMTNLWAVNLSQSELTGSVPASFNNLVNLEHLYLYETNLNELPKLSALTKLGGFHIEGSKFTFEDFDSTGLDFDSISQILYSPQDNLELNNNNFISYLGDSLKLDCQSLTKEDLWSENNEFSIFKDDEEVFGWSADPKFLIDSFSIKDEGKYIIKVRNRIYPELILESDTLMLSYINNPPTDIIINPTNVLENVPLGSIIGEISTTDNDEGDIHNYSFKTGDGVNDVDNSSFAIDGNHLTTAVELDFETKSEYFIYLQTTDLVGLSYEEAFTISVLDVIDTKIEKLEGSKISIYPIPSSDHFFINMGENSPIKKYRMKIMNVLGTTIFDCNIKEPLYKVDLPSHTTAGVYYVQLLDLNGSIIEVRKIFIK